MIFYHHGQPFVGGVEGRTLGNGPALQHSIHFQPEVIMKMRGGMLLHHELKRRSLNLSSLGPPSSANLHKNSCQVRAGMGYGAAGCGDTGLNAHGFGFVDKSHYLFSDSLTFVTGNLAQDSNSVDHWF